MRIYTEQTKARKYAERKTRETGTEYKVYTMRDIFNEFIYIVTRKS